MTSARTSSDPMTSARTGSRAWIGAGAAIVVAYLVTASATLGPSRPLRPFFEGTAPPPSYRWVVPPPELAITNQPPEGATAIVRFVEQDLVEGGRDTVSEGASLTTPDGQASLSIPAGVFVFENRAKSVEVEIEPIDPATIGEPPPGTSYDGNAIRVTATLLPGGGPARLVEQDCEAGGCLAVVMRYPTYGSQLWRHDGTEWIDLEAQNAAASYQIYGSTPEIGEFAVTLTGAHGGGGGGLSVSRIVAFALGGLAVIAAVLFSRRRARGGAASAGKRGRSASSASKRGGSGQRPGRGNPRATGGKNRR